MENYNRNIMRLQKKIIIYDTVIPYFFIVYETETNRFRISFRWNYIKHDCGINIKIYRDFNKNCVQDFLHNLEKFKKVANTKVFDKKNFILSEKYVYNDNTSVFLITRHFDDKDSKCMVLFSKDFNDLDEICKT